MDINQASEILGAQPKDIRKLARKHFTKEGTNWDLSDEQVEILKGLLKGNTKPGSPVTENTRIEGYTAFAQEWLKENYNLELIVPIKINNRLKRTLGLFRSLRKGKKPVSVELGKTLISYYKEEEILDVLKHELVHYACFMLGKPYHDGDQYFENELKRLGVTRTGVYDRRGPKYTYECTKCSGESYTTRQIDPSKYRSRCCQQPIIYIRTDTL